MANRPPDPPAGMSVAERRAARVAHALLYLVIVAMPISGWVINSAANFPLKLFWLIPLPMITPPAIVVLGPVSRFRESLDWYVGALRESAIG